MTALDYAFEVVGYANQLGVEIGFTDEEAIDSLRLPGLVMEEFVFFRICPLATAIAAKDEVLGQCAMGDAKFLISLCADEWRRSAFANGFEAGQSSMSLKKVIFGIGR